MTVHLGMMGLGSLPTTNICGYVDILRATTGGGTLVADSTT